MLVRGLVEYMPPERPMAHLGDPSQPLRPDVGVISAPAMGYSPGFGAKARVLAAMMHPSRSSWPLHLFFTPNGMTSRVQRMLRAMQSRPMVQSVMSADGCERWVKWLRPLDAVVVLSEQTRGRLIAAGLPADKLRRIYPGVPVVKPDAAGNDPAQLILAVIPFILCFTLFAKLLPRISWIGNFAWRFWPEWEPLLP